MSGHSQCDFRFGLFFRFSFRFSFASYFLVLVSFQFYSIGDFINMLWCILHHISTSYWTAYCMLALSLSDKFCYFGIFVFVFVNENHTGHSILCSASGRWKSLPPSYKWCQVDPSHTLQSHGLLALAKLLCMVHSVLYTGWKSRMSHTHLHYFPSLGVPQCENRVCFVGENWNDEVSRKWKRLVVNFERGRECVSGKDRKMDRVVALAYTLVRNIAQLT